MSPSGLKVRDKVVTFSKYYRFEDVLTTEKHVPVGATGIDREIYIRDNGVSGALYDRHMKAWAFFNQAFVMKTDVGRMKRFLSPSEFWCETKEWYQASTIGQQNKLRKKLNFQIARGSDPVESVLEIEDIAAELSLSGVAVDQQHIYSLFVSALHAEYNLRFGN